MSLIKVYNGCSCDIFKIFCSELKWYVLRPVTEDKI